jgi:hypothetical protein
VGPPSRVELFAILFVGGILVVGILWMALVDNPRKDRTAKAETNTAISSLHLSGSSSKRYTKTDEFSFRYYEVTMRYKLSNTGKQSYNVLICMATKVVDDGSKFRDVDWDMADSKCKKVRIKAGETLKGRKTFGRTYEDSITLTDGVLLMTKPYIEWGGSDLGCVEDRPICYKPDNSYAPA